MPRRSSRNDDPVEKWIIRPVIVIFGIFIVGILIEALFGIPSAALLLFVLIGGVYFFAEYYRRFLK